MRPAPRSRPLWLRARLRRRPVRAAARLRAVAAPGARLQFHFFVVDYATTLAASVLTSVTVTLPQRDAPHSDEVELLTADAAPNDL